MSIVSPSRNENKVLPSLEYASVLDTPLNANLDKIAQVVADLCETPIALISLTDYPQHWIKSCAGTSAPESPYDLAFYCQKFLQTTQFMEIGDVLCDERFSDKPSAATEPVIRFCAGSPLIAANANTFGTLCVFDLTPRQLTVAQRDGLQHLTQLVADLVSEHQQLGIREGIVPNGGAIPNPDVPFTSIERTFDVMSGNSKIHPAEDSCQLWQHQNINEQASTQKPAENAITDQEISDLSHHEELINLLDRAIEAVDVGVSVTDVNRAGYPLVYVNQALCTLTGYQYDELVGYGINILHEDCDPQPEHHQIREALAKGEAVQILIQCKRKDKSRFMCELSLAPVRNEKGSLTHYIGIRRDVTSKLELEAQSHNARKIEAIGRLSGGIAHDFNNLLSVISGNLELLNSSVTDEHQRHFLNEARSATKMGARLTHRLLTFARQRELDPIVLNANDLVLDTIDLLKSTIGETITLSSDLTPELWTIRADPSEIENTVVNLTINARDSMPTGGTINVSTRNVCVKEDDIEHDANIEPGDYILLCVSDTGSGMTDEVKARIFEPFFTTKEPDKGTGMGLASIHGFVHQSGGHVHVHSELGHGTIISLYLPKYIAESNAVVSNQADEVSSSHIDARILVVEDNDMVRELTINQLQILGFTTEQACNGPEAVNYLENNSNIDLVLSDIVMSGGMSGYDVAHWVHTHLPNLKFLLTSGYSDQIVEDDTIQATPLQILKKPYSLVELQQVVSSMLGSDVVTC